MDHKQEDKCKPSCLIYLMVMLVLSLMISALGNHNVLAAEMKTAKQDGWLLEGRLIDTTDWNSLCNPPEPELLPNSITWGKLKVGKKVTRYE